MIHPLAENRHDLFGPGPHPAELGHIQRIEPCHREIRGTGAFEHLVEPMGVGEEIGIDQPAFIELNKELIKKRYIAAGAQFQMQIRAITACRPAGIDRNDLRPPCLTRRQHALIKNRMAPGEVRSDQNDRIRPFQILVSPGHRIRAKGAFVPSNGGGHAQS